MSAASESAGVPHSIQKFLLIWAGFLARKFDLDIQRSAVRNTMPPDIGFAMLPDPNDRTVFRIELPYRMVHGIAAIFTERSDNLVL